jgi:flagellar hook-associated protein FlgK
MPSTFFGLTIASSGLNSAQIAMNVTANNIANVNTKGYTRQDAIRQAAEALRVHQRYGSAGSGVETTAIRQIRDLYYDVRYWNNSTILGMYEQKLNYAQQIEEYLLDDDAMKGFATVLDEMFNAMDALKTDAGSRETRLAFLSKTQNFASYFNSLSTGFKKIRENANQEVKNAVDIINSIGAKISVLNKQINLLDLQGGNANELRDQRALLLDELSAIVPIEAKETEVVNSNYPNMLLGGTNFVVKIHGQVLVNNDDYNTLELVPDSDGMYAIRWSHTQSQLGAATMSGGSLRGLLDVRDGNSTDKMGIPYYMSQMNDFVRTFAEAMNNLQLNGKDANGNDGIGIFVYICPIDGSEKRVSDFVDPLEFYSKMTAGNLAVSLEMMKDPNYLSTVSNKAYSPDDVGENDLILSMLRLKSQEKVFRAGSADQFLHTLLSDNAVDTQKSELFYRNYTNLSNAIEMKRMSISGVDTDEEAMNIVKFQNSYNLASRIIQTMTQMYDRLILHTGV